MRQGLRLAIASTVGGSRIQGIRHTVHAVVPIIGSSAMMFGNPSRNRAFQALTFPVLSPKASASRSAAAVRGPGIPSMGPL